MPRGWEGNRRSGDALPTYGLKGLKKEDEHPAYAPVGVWHLYLMNDSALCQ